MFVPYHRYVGVLKWLTLSLFAYVGIVFTVHIDWRAVARARCRAARSTVTGDSLTLIVAIFGTTISPYLFFWQSSQEVEEEEADPEAAPLLDEPQQAPRELARIGWDTWLGMGVSNVVAFFIMLATAVTLHANGAHRHPDHRAGGRGAEADRRATLAFLLFSDRHRRHRPAGRAGAGGLGGLRGRARCFGWPTGLEQPLREARGFYAVIAAAIAARHRASTSRRSIRSRRCSGARSSTASSPCRSWWR